MIFTRNFQIVTKWLNYQSNKIYFTYAILFLTFILSIIIRIDYHLLLGGVGSYLDWANKYFFGGISPEYLADSKRILAGYVYNDLSYPPGYAIFLAFLQYIHIDSLQTMRIVQGIIDSLSIFALYGISRWAGINRFLAWFAALIYAVTPLFATGSVIVLAEWISPSIVIWSIFFFTKLFNFNKKVIYFNAFLLGSVIAIGAMFRPDLIMLIIPFMVASYFFIFKNNIVLKIYPMLVMALSFFVIVGSWGLHNKIHFNHWIFTSASGGDALWEGLGIIEDNPYGYVVSDRVAGDLLLKKGLEWHSVKANKYMQLLYFQAWKEHPIYVVKTILKRWKEIINASNYSGFSAIEPPSYVKIATFYERYGIILLLIGIYFYRREKKIVFLLSLPLVYALFSIGLVHFESRYTRYTGLSYIFATIMLLHKAHLWLSSRSAYMKYKLSTIFYLVMLIFILSWPFRIHSIVINKIESPKLIAQLKATDYMSVPHNIKTLTELKWHRMKKNNHMKWQGNNLVVSTSNVSSRFDYYAKLNTKKSLGFIINYKFKLINGKASIGVWDNVQQQWIAVVNMDKPGKTYQGKLYAPMKYISTARLILENSNPNNAGLASKFIIEKLDLINIKS